MRSEREKCELTFASRYCPVKMDAGEISDAGIFTSLAACAILSAKQDHAQAIMRKNRVKLGKPEPKKAHHL